MPQSFLASRSASAGGTGLGVRIGDALMGSQTPRVTVRPKASHRHPPPVAGMRR